MLLLLLALVSLSLPAPSSQQQQVQQQQHQVFFCEDVLPPGYVGFGGAITLTQGCAWRPQVHWVSSLSGRLDKPLGALRSPVVSLAPGQLPKSSSGPNRFMVTDVVLANFTISDPAGDGGLVLWPQGLLQPGTQAGSSVPRRLYLQDVRMLVDSGSLQRYIRFFRDRETLVYSDNATFLHVPYWSDNQTFAANVGLLLAVPGAPPEALAGPRPPPGRNWVLAADDETLVPLLEHSAATSTPLPLLVYLSSNVSLALAQRPAAGLPVNRHVILVGGASQTTGVDFGMQANQLALLGTWSHVTFSRVLLENLAPGDAHSVAFAGPYDVLMGYNVWALLYSRSVSRLSLHNCTLSLTSLEVDDYMYRATLFNVQPVGFERQLEVLNANVFEWNVAWVASNGSDVQAAAMRTTAMEALACNYSAEAPAVAPRLPLPARAANGSLQAGAPGATLDQILTHIGAGGVVPAGSGASSPGDSETALLTSNITLGAEAPPGGAGGGPLAAQLVQHLQEELRSAPGLRHTLLGIASPPVTLDLAYSTDLFRLPADSPPGHLALVNVAALRLSQGPAAAQPSASMMTPAIYTHLLWSIPRTPANVVWLSNVTLWIPAAEFSYIRSHTTSAAPSNFTLSLEGGAEMRFYDAVDLRAEGLHIGKYEGPGLLANSLSLRLETGWSQGGEGPQGFWSSAGSTEARGGGGRTGLSDAMVVVLAVCLVTAVVASVLAVLAFILWRRRAAEAQAAAAGGAKAGGKPAAGASRGGGASDGGASGSQHSLPGGAAAGGAGAGAIALPDAPVHDSSDSYHLAAERAQLTAELARSQFGTARPHGVGAGGGSFEGALDAPGQPGRPPAAAAAGPSGVNLSSTSMASDACLQRLHSAITSMSQDVLSRRLHVGSSSGGGSGTPGAAAGLSRPSPLGPGWGPAGGDSPKPPPQAQGQAQQLLLQQQQQQQQPDGDTSGSVISLRSLAAANRDAAPATADTTGSADNSADPEDQQQQQQQQQDPGAAAARAAGAAAKASAAAAAAAAGAAAALGELKLLQLVGQGTFGQVYKALWRRRCVAVKVLQLPATAGSSDVAPWVGIGRVSSHREKMAVMETVVSTTMSHPNIVQVYTYVLQPLMSGQDGGVAAASSGGGGGARAGLQPLQRLDGRRAARGKQQAQLEAPLPEPQRQQDQQRQGQPPPQQDQQQEALAPALAPDQQQRGRSGDVPPDAADRSDAAPTTRNSFLGSSSSGGGSQARKRSHHQQTSSCSDSSQSLKVVQQRLLDGAAGEQQWQQRQQQQQLSGKMHKLTPEVAAAAAAALPAAAAGAAAPAPLAAASSPAGAGPSGSSTDSSDSDGTGDMASGGPPGPVLVGWELRLVMEFCDAGSLRTALDHKLLIDRTTGLPALECVLFLAHDVACAMIHLHSEHLLHGDLKASNVLLKRTAPRLPVPPAEAAAPGAGAAGERAAGLAGGAGRRTGQLLGPGLSLMAKVADFGLSLTLGPADTHVSQMHMGTLTHMAPELLLHGRASKASDVYAYGVLLWELATGRRPYSGTPVGMLAHKVVQRGWRPAWPGGCSLPVQLLAEACWAQEPADRPCFEQIVQQLEDMASQLDHLKQQQAQSMAAAAAPLCSLASAGHPELDLGHELTPSMMEDLMPSGFSGGSDHSGGMCATECDTVYEMSQLSGGSQDRDAVAAAAAAAAVAEAEEEEEEEARHAWRPQPALTQ